MKSTTFQKMISKFVDLMSPWATNIWLNLKLGCIQRKVYSWMLEYLNLFHKLVTILMLYSSMLCLLLVPSNRVRSIAVENIMWMAIYQKFSCWQMVLSLVAVIPMLALSMILTYLEAIYHCMFVPFLYRMAVLGTWMNLESGKQSRIITGILYWTKLIQGFNQVYILVFQKENQ